MQTHGSDLPVFGDALRDCRRAQKRSQLELAMEAEVSQRHLSFLESGRAQPSREMVLQLAQALDLPLRERNRLLLSAGYAGVYPQRSLEAGEMQAVRGALDLLLKHHEPYPALAVDRVWNVVMTNNALLRVFSLVGDLDQMWQRVCGDGPRNIFKLTFHPEGLRPFIVNFEEIASALIARTAREALEHPAVHDLLEEVLRYPGLPSRWRSMDLGVHTLPVLPTQFKAHGVSLSMFTMISTFGTPQDVTTDELRVETFYPADAVSEQLLRSLAQSR